MMRVSKYVESTGEGEIPEVGDFVRHLAPITVVGRLSVIVIGNMTMEDTSLPPGRYDLDFRVPIEVSGEDIFIEMITRPRKSYEKGEALPAPPEYREEGFALFMEYASRLGLVKQSEEPAEGVDQVQDVDQDDMHDEYDDLQIDEPRHLAEPKTDKNQEDIESSEPAEDLREPDNGASRDVDKQEQISDETQVSSES